MGLKRIQAQIIHENKASIRVFEKAGFIYEGTLKDYCYYQHSDTLRTMVIMACTPKDTILDLEAQAIPFILLGKEKVREQKY